MPEHLAAKPGAQERGRAADVSEVAVGQNQAQRRADLFGERLAVAALGFAVALEGATVDEQPSACGLEVVAAPGDAARGAEKGEPSGHPSTLRTRRSESKR